MRPGNTFSSPPLNDMDGVIELDPESRSYGLREALQLTRDLAARPPPFLRRAHVALRSTADGRWLPPPPSSSVCVSLLYVEAATATVDGLSASILRASGQRVRSTIVGIPAERSRGEDSLGVGDGAIPAKFDGGDEQASLDGRPLPLSVSATLDAGAGGQQGRSRLPDGPFVPAVTGTVPVIDRAAARRGPPAAYLGNGGDVKAAAAAAPSSTGAVSALSARGTTGLHLSCALDDFDAWCESTAAPSQAVGPSTEHHPTSDCPVVLRVSATGYAPIRLVLRRRRYERVERHRRLEGIVRLPLRRLRGVGQRASGVAGGRRLVSASERRLSSLVVVARVEWKAPYITWPLAHALSDGSGVAVKDDATTRRNGELPSQRMWRLSRHPISSMAVRLDVRAPTEKGVDLLKTHRRDLTCPVCNAVVPRTGGTESAFTALNVVLAHMDAEHVRLGVHVEYHSFTRPGRGVGELSLSKGKGASHPPLLFHASLLVTLRDGHPTMSPADFFFTRRLGPPGISGGRAAADRAVSRDPQRRTPRRTRRGGQTHPAVMDGLSPSSLAFPLLPAAGVRKAPGRHRNGNDGGTAPAASADKLATDGATVAVHGKRKRTSPAGLGSVCLYRAGINIPLSEAEALDGDLHDMSDVRWLERLDTDRMLDVSDVTVREVYYMRLWNSFIRPSATGFGVYGDLHMRMALVAFMRTHRVLLERLSMWGLVLSHLHELYALGVLDCAGLLAVARAYREPPEDEGGGGNVEKGSGVVNPSMPMPSSGVNTNSGGSLFAAVGSKVGAGLPAVTLGEHIGGLPSAAVAERGGGSPAISKVGEGGYLPTTTAGNQGAGSQSGRLAAPSRQSNLTPQAPPTHLASHAARLAVSPSAGGRSGSGSSARAVLPTSTRPVASLHIVEVTDNSTVHAAGARAAQLPGSAAAVKVSGKPCRVVDGRVADDSVPSRVDSATGGLNGTRRVSTSNTPTMKGGEVSLVVALDGSEPEDVGPSFQQLTPRLVSRAGTPARSSSANRGVFTVKKKDVEADKATRTKRQRINGWSAVAMTTTVASAAAALPADAADAMRRRGSAASGEAADVVVVAGPPTSARLSPTSSTGSRGAQYRTPSNPGCGVPVVLSSSRVGGSSALSLAPGGRRTASGGGK